MSEKLKNIFFFIKALQIIKIEKKPCIYHIDVVLRPSFDLSLLYTCSSLLFLASEALR